MIWSLLACTGGPGVALVGDVEIHLAAPYSEDPFAGADTFRIVVRDASGAEVARGDGTPASPPALTGIEALGLVDIEVTARAGEQVLAAGRSGPVALGPGDDLAIDVLFLPVNHAVPLADQEPVEARSDATSILLADGRVLLIGGGSGGGVVRSTELWDPLSGFSPAADLAGGALDVQTAPYGEHGTLIAGGRTALSSAEDEGVFAVDPLGRALDAVPDMNKARAAFCLAPLGGQAAVALGGRGVTVAPDHSVEVLRLNPDTAAMNWSEFTYEGDVSTVSGCATTAALNVVTADRDSADWSVFAFASPSMAIDERHKPLLGPGALEGAVMIPLREDEVLVIGGRNQVGDVRRNTWLIDAGLTTYDNASDLAEGRAFARARWWRGERVLAVALGIDADLQDVRSLELVDVDSGPLLDAIDVGVGGAAMEVLPGGAIAFLGGTPSGAVLVMPWVDP